MAVSTRLKVRSQAAWWSAVGVVSVALALTGTPPASADESSLSQRYHSIRGSVYSKRLRRVEDNGFGARLKLQLSAAVLKYESLGEFLDPDTVHFQSIGVRPRVNFEFPTRWRHIAFVPSAEISLTHQFDTGRNLLSGALTAAVRYQRDRERSRVVSVLSAKYGTRYDEDGLNLDDYFRLKLSGRFRQNLKWKIGEHTTTISPFASVSYFFDELELGVVEELTNSVNRQLEIGLTFSTLPRMRLWKIKVPEIDVSFIYGDDYSGIKVRF